MGCLTQASEKWTKFRASLELSVHIWLEIQIMSPNEMRFLCAAFRIDAIILTSVPLHRILSNQLLLAIVLPSIYNYIAIGCVTAQTVGKRKKSIAFSEWNADTLKHQSNKIIYSCDLCNLYELQREHIFCRFTFHPSFASPNWNLNRYLFGELVLTLAKMPFSFIIFCPFH